MRLKSCARLDVGAWLLARSIIHFFHLLSNIFFTTLCTRLGLSHPLVLGVSHYICSQPLDPMGIHLFRCAHGEEKMASHDVVQIVFVTIVKIAGFHVSQKKIHVISPLALQSSRHRIDIVLLINGVRTLVNVIITNPIWVDLVSRVALFCGVTVTITTQAKDGLHCDRFPTTCFSL